MIRIHQAYAWNPTIQGTKCEDTTLLTAEGVANLRRSADWPRSGAFPAADILVK